MSSSVVLLDGANHFTDEYFSVLTDRRFTVRRVTSLEGTLASLVPRSGEPPDVLLLNGSGRPVADAMADLARVREADPDLPVVVLTLEPSPVVASRALALGAVGVLSAPWLPRDVTATLERAAAVGRRRRDGVRARAFTLGARLARLEVEARRAADLERANERLGRELAAAREANGRIARALRTLEARAASLEARLTQIHALADLSTALTGDLDGAAIAEVAAREAARALGADGVALSVLDGDALVPRFVLGPTRGASGPIRPGEGIQGWVARTGRPVIVADASVDPRVVPADRMGVNGERMACVPLLVRDRVLGTLLLSRTDARGPAFGTEDVELLARLGTQAAVALDHAGQVAAIEQSYLTVLRGLVRAVEARDPSTRDHSENVTFFSLRLARAAGLDEARRTVVRRAGILHDVGHALISTAVTAKAGRLTADEWTVMRDHPVLGHRILEPVGFLGDTRTVVLDHQERFDGSGYPNGRAGDALAVETRIVSITDAFDSMTRDRPYRPALTVEGAIAELRRHRGTQFDPDLVDGFTDLLHRDEWELPGGSGDPAGADEIGAGGGRAA